MRLYCTLAVAALMTFGLSGCGGGIDEGIEPNVDMTKTYETPAKAEMGPPKKSRPSRKKVGTDVEGAAPGGG